MFTMEKSTKFTRKAKHIARRAWNLIRLALLWARKRGLFRSNHRLAIALAKLTRRLTHSRREARGALAYGDREFSFDDTPVFHVRMIRRSSPSSQRFRLPRIPCIRPEVVDFDRDEGLIYGSEDEMFGSRYEGHDDGGEEGEEESGETKMDCEEEEINFKAERFIADFYKQMKLQRQISHLRHKNAIENGD